MDQRIDHYLHASGLAGRDPRVVPLTGDASDRQYFRILIPDGESIVLSSSGVRCEVGAFLGPGERGQLATRLRALLEASRNPPTT